MYKMLWAVWKKDRHCITNLFHSPIFTYMFSSLFLQGWLLYTSKSVACSLHSVPIQNMSKQRTDFVGIISLSLSLTHVYAQPLLVYISLAIDGYWLFFIYIVVCVHHRKRIASPSSILQHQVHRLSAHMVGVELEIYWCQLFIMVTNGIAIVNVRYVVACWIIVSANDGGIIMTVAM